ncbi:MAG: PAS domain-containing protein [Gemmatimonadaceae bacterium]|nr:PAS domain-containing protein [Gemmatimonadaceae bacterium]
MRPAQAPVLDALAGIIAGLAVDRPLDESVVFALDSLRVAIGAEEAAVWLTYDGALVRTWDVGVAALTLDDVSAAAHAPPANAPVAVATIPTGNGAPGRLAVRCARPVDADGRLLITAVANLLAPALVHADRNHRLEVEVEERTAAIDRERRFMDRIIDSMPVGLYVIDRDYRIQAWNRKREAGMQGVSRDEAIGRTIFEVLHRQPAEMLRREFDDVFATGRIQEYQMESVATGELRTYRISKIPMRLGDSGVTHVITIGEDITDWREAQTRFAHAEKLAAIGQLAAGVMHEINNPLATIAAIAESLAFKIDDARKAGAVLSPDIPEYLTIIDNEVARCKQIVDGLLDFSRPKQPLRERVDINEVIERTLMLLKHHVRFKRLPLERDLDQGVPRVPRASGEQLVQVFMALLLNAMDAMTDRPGKVVVRTRRGRSPSECVIAEVVDQGAGIPRSELGKIFEPFYTTKEAGKGTGLGLSICYGIVQDHGGRLEVESAVGVGSTFRVVLPGVEE